MKFCIYTFCFLTAALFFAACQNSDVYNEKAKTLDSLNGVLTAMVTGLEEADTSSLQRAVARFRYYKQFMRQDLKDTLNKIDADALKSFYVSGNNLENYYLNRSTLLARAGLINSQLQKLRTDVKNSSLEIDQLSRYTLQEKKETEILVEAARGQQKIFHESLQEFKSALVGIEQLIRSRNHGELPTIIKDTLTL